MSDAKTERQSINAGGAKSTRPVNHWKRWRFKTSVVLMLLGVCAIVVYLLRAGLAKQYEGLGAALCAIACGGFMVWHVIHLFAEEDAFDEQQLKETNMAAPPPESGHTGTVGKESVS